MIEVALAYACGCRDVWRVARVPDHEPQEQRTDLMCVPEHCQACQGHGRPCPDREAAKLYQPVQFTDIQPIRKRKKA
jgi:hypothetical protein